MTHLQQKTIYEMMRQGLHTQLDIAEHCWQENKQFELGRNIFVPELLHSLIQKCNREVIYTLH